MMCISISISGSPNIISPAVSTVEAVFESRICADSTLLSYIFHVALFAVFIFINSKLV